MSNLKGPKILMLDIETAPLISYHWGLWDQNIGVDQILSDSYLLTWAAKWYGNPALMASGIWEYENYDENPKDDSGLVNDLVELMNQADYIVGHNVKRFDLAVIKARCIINGLEPPLSTGIIDTLSVAKKHFKFTSNKLDSLGRVLGVGRKVSTGGFELWKGAVEGDVKAQKKMVKYNKQDVVLLEAVYDKLKPFSNDFPPLSKWLGDDVCNACGSSHLINKGYYHTKTASYERYKCKDCGHNQRVGKSLTRVKTTSLG